MLGNPIARAIICLGAVGTVIGVLAVSHVQSGHLLSAALNLFLIVVLITALRWGTRYAILVALLSALAFNLVLPPVGHFHLREPRFWTLLTACLITGIIAGQLSRRVRQAVLDANERRVEAVAAHERFRELVNSLEGIVWEADAGTFAFTFVSEQAERVLGYPTGDWLSQPAFWKDHLHPDDRDWAVQFCVRATAEKRSHDFEYRMIAADQRVVWVRDLVTVVVENGRATRLRGVIVDITKRKQAEEALRTVEKELRQVIETIPAMAWSAAPDGSSMFVNQRWTEYTGLSVEATVGAGWHTAVHPEDVKRHLSKWQASMATGTRLEDEIRLRRAADGQYRWFSIRAVPLCDEQGKILKWYGIVTDIEDRRRTEQAFRESERNLAEAQRLTHTGSFVWDVKTRQALHLSDEWYRIYGFDLEADQATRDIKGDVERVVPRVFLEGRAWERRIQRVHPEDRSRWEAAVERAIAEKSDYELEYRVLLPNGTTRYVHAIGHPVLDDCREVVQFMGSLTDITERKRAEEERERLHQLQEDLARINRITTMGELTASLAHEVNQPIAAAVTNANTSVRWLASDTPNLEEAREAAKRAAKDATRAAEIINRIRSLFRKGAAERELVNVNEVIDEIIVLLRSEAKRSGIAIESDLEADLPQVAGDRVQLQQVIMNLAMNSMDAMREVDGTRKLTLTSKRDGNQQLVVSVRDTGIGLPPDMSKIFDAFFTTKPHGTGMGLAISRTIVESHGGRLWADSNNGGGASFSFSLPIAAEAQP